MVLVMFNELLVAEDALEGIRGSNGMDGAFFSLSTLPVWIPSKWLRISQSASQQLLCVYVRCTFFLEGQ